MNDQTAKLKTLQDIIDTMDDHMLGAASTKAKAKKPTPAAGAAAPVSEPAAPAASDDLDGDTAAQLKKFYEDEDLKYNAPPSTT